MGLYPAPPSKYEIPGLEFAGTVKDMGSEVTGFSIGDQVMGIVTSGAYAELLTVHHRQVMVIPESLNMQQAAAIPEAWLTAYDALVDKGDSKAPNMSHTRRCFRGGDSSNTNRQRLEQR
ncbi:MAG: hypothetical protein CM15mP49_00290 [Actinomycetota bacterium]|nr:MAG: hypothetical protein CM15mP49_00290 [Actinomycetota bacterium]